MVSIPVMVLSFKCTYPHSQWRGRMVLITLILDSENNVFSSVSKPVFAEKGGCACLVGNDRWQNHLRPSGHLLRAI